MDDTNTYLINNNKHHHDQNHPKNTKNKNNSSKYYTHFLYKALIVSIFLLVLPLFPSQAPEFINQTLNTRGWEFLHLVFVGIAVSYGLFCKINDESQHEQNNNYHSKFENAQSYVSRFLQLSSVFDEENNAPFKSDVNRVQTWSSQYQRNEAVTVVEDENPVLDQQQRLFLSGSSRVGEKPLLLPVRSLKSRVLDANDGVSKLSKSKRFSSNAYEEREVLSSPIPRQSRSGRMEMKSNEEIQIPPVEESEFNRSLKSIQSVRSSLPNSATSSPRLSPSPSMTSSPEKYAPSPSTFVESQGKIAEDFLKKSFYRSPPPPPPPPSMIRKATSMKQTLSHENKDLKRCFTGVDANSVNLSRPKSNFTTKDLRRSVTSIEPKANFAMPKSVRTTRNTDVLSTARKEKEFDEKINYSPDKRSKEVQRWTMEHTIPMQQPNFFAEDEDNKVVNKFDLESVEESISKEDEEVVDIASPISSTPANSHNEEPAGHVSSDEGPDVDKKADEFIAKFREQIRLQRIESIKISSTKQIKRNTQQ